MRGTFPALYSCALALVLSGGKAMTKPVRKRRRVITTRPVQGRRQQFVTGKRWEVQRDSGARAHDPRLADQRTVPRRAPGSLAAECPGWQENGTEGSRESGPLEGRYKANLAVPTPRP